MATFSSLLLPALFLAALLRATAVPLGDICRQTRDPPRCTRILLSGDTRSAAAPLPILAEIVIDALSYDAGQTKIKVHNLFLMTKDPNLKRIYGIIENLYLDALDALQIAPEYLQQRKYGKLLEVAGIVGRAAGGSAAAFRGNAAVEKASGDVGVIGEALAAIARNLQ